jgi:hypothetical protein
VPAGRYGFLTVNLGLIEPLGEVGQLGEQPPG